MEDFGGGYALSRSWLLMGFDSSSHAKTLVHQFRLYFITRCIAEFDLHTLFNFHLVFVRPRGTLID